MAELTSPTSSPTLLGTPRIEEEHTRYIVLTSPVRKVVKAVFRKYSTEKWVRIIEAEFTGETYITTDTAERALKKYSCSEDEALVKHYKDSIQSKEQTMNQFKTKYERAKKDIEELKKFTKLEELAQTRPELYI